MDILKTVRDTAVVKWKKLGRLNTDLIYKM